MEQRFGLDIDACPNRGASECRIVLGRTCLRADPALAGEFDENCQAPELLRPAIETAEAAPAPAPDHTAYRPSRLETWLTSHLRRILKD